MEKLVTIRGISLFLDEGKFYSTHPKRMENLIKTSSLNIKIIGSINLLKRIFIFSSSLDESKCITILTNSQERAEKLIRKKFKEWGYKGDPILIL